MSDDLRFAWSVHIEPDDYEAHMASVGQAQANAKLLAELFDDYPPPSGARVHIAGAGTGQYFDYWPPSVLAPYDVLFTDINPIFLLSLTARAQGLRCTIRIEDIEEPAVGASFDLTVAILVLEHVDWRRAVSALCARTDRAFVVIQENPPDPPARELRGTMDILRESRPHLIPRAELIAAFQQERFTLTRTSTREVPDGKRMTGLDFTRRP
jgi:hypothetical protein